MKDNTIRNQKVFIKLCNVLKLQNEYSNAKRSETSNNLPNVERKARLKAVVETLKWVIETLELPII